MKKILAMFLAMMLISSMFVIGVSARTQSATFTIGKVEVVPGTATVEVPVTISADAYPFYVCGIDATITVPAGLTLSAVSALGTTTNVFDNSQSQLSEGRFVVADPDGGYGDAGAPYIEKATDIILTFAVADASIEADYAIAWVESTNAYDEEFEYVDINFVDGAVSVKAAGSNEPTVNEFADFTSDFVVDAATVGGEATDYQIGAGLGMKVSTGDLTFTDMIWSLTTADGKLYSKAIPLGAVNGDVDLVATFVNGVRADNAFGKEPVTTINFTGVNAIFKDADGAEWFTDVTDAK